MGTFCLNICLFIFVPRPLLSDITISNTDVRCIKYVSRIKKFPRLYRILFHRTRGRCLRSVLIIVETAINYHYTIYFKYCVPYIFVLTRLSPILCLSQDFLYNVVVVVAAAVVVSRLNLYIIYHICLNFTAP